MYVLHQDSLYQLVAASVCKGKKMDDKTRHQITMLISKSIFTFHTIILASYIVIDIPFNSAIFPVLIARKFCCEKKSCQYKIHSHTH